ncbi:MAG: hypothetical protein H0U70_11730 [Tatlockia sp.]|nr:hypothetical protein [Tatlockia sp.]
MPLSQSQAQTLYETLCLNNLKPTPWIDALVPLNGKRLQTNELLQSELIRLRESSLNRKSALIHLDNLENKAIINDFDKSVAKKIRVFLHREENINIDILDVYARGLDSARAVTEILKHAPKSSDDLISSKLKNAESSSGIKLIDLINSFQQKMAVLEFREQGIIDSVKSAKENIKDSQAKIKAGAKNLQHKLENDTKHLDLAYQENKENRAKAKKELTKFNGALSNLLVSSGAISERSKANKSINFVRDFLWKKDICSASCVWEDIQENTSMLRYAEPLKFSISQKDKGLIDIWDDSTQPLKAKLAWKNKLIQALGGHNDSWFKSFFTENLNHMMQLSSTPMSRFTPNPANAFDCTDIVIKNDCVVNMGHHLRAAITEPLNAGDTKSKQDITNWNHLLLISKKRLESELNVFMEKWGDLYKEGPIPLTILHQTLIGDEASLTPDQTKATESRISGSVIDSKLLANQYIRRLLATNNVIRRLDGRIEFKEKKLNEALPKNAQLVEIELLETNNCINMWTNILGINFARVRNNDLNHSRDLINKAVQLFEKAKPNNKAEFTTVINFLQSTDHSFFSSYKFQNDSLKKAVKTLSQELLDFSSDKFGDLDEFARENLALSLQAAVELKCTVHETWAGALRRNIANFSLDYIRPFPLLGFVIDLIIRATLTLSAALIRIVSLPITFLQSYKHLNDRKEIYKASYEGLLAESIGVLQGGCMSSADRAGEMAEQRAAMRKQFSVENKIISFNDSAEEKTIFYKTYGRTQAKHDFVEVATGTAATCDTETKGFSFPVNLMSEHAETKEEQRLSYEMHSLRKGRFDSRATAEKYLAKKPGISQIVSSAPQGDSSKESSGMELNSSNSDNSSDSLSIKI